MNNMSERETMKYIMKNITREWYLYHSYKNEGVILYAIFASCLFVFFNDALWFLLLIWGYYFYYCSKNNEELNTNSEILSDRERWKQRHIKDGNWELCKDILGIR